MVAYVYFSIEFARTLVVELGLPKIPLRKSQLMMKYILRDLKSPEAALRWEKDDLNTLYMMARVLQACFLKTLE